MDRYTLEAFVNLAKTLSFTKTAEIMHVSQSAFSRQINKLEEELGAELFRRNRREVELTPAGQTLLCDAEELINRFSEIETHIAQAKSGQRGALCIGFLQDSPHAAFAPVIRAFRDSFPDIALSFQELGLSASIDALISRRIDVAFSLSQADTPEVIQTLETAQYPFCAVMPKEHALAEENAVDICQLEGLPLVTISPHISHSGYTTILNQCRSAGFVPEIAACADIIPSLFLLIEAGIGLGILPLSAAEMNSKLRFVPLRGETMQLHSILAWREGNDNPCLASFLDVAEYVLEQ